ncbi:hypothetical protein LPB142_12190 [Rhodobacter xanthinilyticus]|uniref:Cyclic nucleotide-binding protein n=1 Tax=Rhodobacter xanthinilyticus TaxID=1850250 RepID=A0A1D9MDY3_9RHOB|nr:Crp/Fnr family transcriptional regulator [Rhodobacter xanthinilyticus]AOZ69988.1 hypothetical protein LPB142_12190 [Rhodobacter xanthinilyticus]
MADTFALITRSCALLRAAGPQTRERLRRSARLRHYHRGETIFLHQSRAQACHLVLEGWVKLYRIAPNGCEALLGIHTRGETFGLADGLRGAARSFGADAASDCDLLILPAPEIRAAAATDPGLQEALLHESFAATDGLLDQITDLKSCSALQRVAAFLCAHACVTEDGLRVILPFEKHLIAAYLGIKPESLSRALSRLKPLGVTISRDIVLIRDPEALDALLREEAAA